VGFVEGAAVGRAVGLGAVGALVDGTAVGLGEG
jgi:hypothetical protein